MFFHIFAYRLRCMARDIQTLFWSAIFPLLLATLFGLAFSNLNSGEVFSKIPVAVVNTQESGGSDFYGALGLAEHEGRPLFEITDCTSAQQADRLLKGDAVAGVFTLDDEGLPVVWVSESGLHQSILKSFADAYMQTVSAFETIAAHDPALLAQAAASLEVQPDYFKTLPAGAASPDDTVIYYFALIAMACLYGSFQGLTTVTSIQANQSDVAARCNLVPVSKVKMFGASLLATLLVHLLSVLLLIAYLWLVIGVPFGGQLGYILLVCLAGSCLGVALGAVVSALIKRREGIKIAVILSLSMVFPFLAGLMFPGMKYIVAKNAPVLAWLNPANLIADAFYALYYYDTLTRYWLNIAALFGFSAVFLVLVFVVMRRQKYASL